MTQSIAIIVAAALIAVAILVVNHWTAERRNSVSGRH